MVVNSRSSLLATMSYVVLNEIVHVTSIMRRNWTNLWNSWLWQLQAGNSIESRWMKWIEWNDWEKQSWVHWGYAGVIRASSYLEPGTSGTSKSPISTPMCVKEGEGEKHSRTEDIQCIHHNEMHWRHPNHNRVCTCKILWEELFLLVELYPHY